MIMNMNKFKGLCMTNATLDVRETLKAVMKIAASDQRATLVENGMVDTLVEILKSNPFGFAREALLILAYFVDAEHRATIRTSMKHETLSKYLRYESYESYDSYDVREPAALLTSNLLIDADEALDAEWIELAKPLIDICKDNPKYADPERKKRCRAYAAKALTVLAINNGKRTEAIVGHGALQPLHIMVLTESLTKARNNAIVALKEICKAHEPSKEGVAKHSARYRTIGIVYPDSEDPVAELLVVLGMYQNKESALRSIRTRKPADGPISKRTASQRET